MSAIVTRRRASHGPRFVVAACLLGASLVAGAASPAPRESLDSPPWLPDSAAVAAAIEAHPNVRAARAERDAGQALGARLRAGPHETRVELGAEQRIGGEPGARGDVNFALERGWRLPAKARADRALAEAEAERGRLRLLEARHDLSRELLSRWFDWLGAAADARRAQAQVEWATQMLDRVERRMRAGDASRLEQAQALAERDALAAAAQGARMREEASRLELTRAFPEVAAEPARRAGWIEGIDAYDADARSALPEAATIDAQRIVEQSHLARFARAEAELMRLRGERAGLERRADPVVGVRGYTDRFAGSRSIGIYVSVPLSGAARDADWRAALARSDQAGAERDAALRALAVEVETATRALEQQHAAWQARRAARAGAEQRLAMTQRGFELGELSLTELQLARRQLIDASAAESAALLGLLQRRARRELDAHRLWDFDGD